MYDFMADIIIKIDFNTLTVENISGKFLASLVRPKHASRFKFAYT